MAVTRQVIVDALGGGNNVQWSAESAADAVLRGFTEHDLVVVEGEYLADLQRSQGEARRLAGWKFKRGDS